MKAVIMAGGHGMRISSVASGVPKPVIKIEGKPFGVTIEYYFEKEPLGNAGALFRIKENLTEDFFN